MNTYDQIRNINEELSDLRERVRELEQERADLIKARRRQVRRDVEGWELFRGTPERVAQDLNQAAAAAIQSGLEMLPEENASKELLLKAFFHMGAEMRPALKAHSEHGAYDTEPLVVFSEMAAQAIADHQKLEDWQVPSELHHSRCI